MSQRVQLFSDKAVRTASFVGTRRYVLPADDGELVVGELGKGSRGVAHRVPGTPKRGMVYGFEALQLRGIDHERILVMDQDSVALLRYQPGEFELLTR